MKSAGRQQPSAVRADRRIIERPRLIKLLDDTDARTILLLAPAGYGKTTLARQWAKTLNKAVWMTLAPAHVDVAWLSEDVARAIDGEANGTARLIREHIKARANPQRAARELARVLGEQLEAADIRWLIIDEYQELAGSPEAEEFFETLNREVGARTLVASRVRPAWANGRRFVYGEIFEITRDELAMTEPEIVAVLGKRPAAAHLSRQADGWPAVIGLAAALEDARVPRDAVPEALHRYLAEELFHRASPQLREALMARALQRSPDAVADITRQPELGAEAERLGFACGGGKLNLHPLLKEFLLEKLVALPDADERVRSAVLANVEDQAWDEALALVERFNLTDLAESTLAASYKPLIREGRLATLETYARTFQGRFATCAPSAYAVLAEVAFREGNLELASDWIEGASRYLSEEHPAASRAAALAGQVAFFNADFPAAEAAFRRAHRYATDDRDATEAAFGLSSAAIFGERAGAEAAVAVLRSARDRSPIDFLRFASSEVSLRLLGRTTDGLTGNLHDGAAREMLSRVDDPRARTALTYAIASALTQRSEYAQAREWLSLFFKDANSYGLEFPMPYANWTLAQCAIGQRRFGEAERALQAIEDLAARKRERHHEVNARVLRARLLLQTGELEAALQCVMPEPDVPLVPSWHAEYIATRALVLACTENGEAADIQSREAEKMSRALQVRGLAQAARTISVLTEPRRRSPAIARLVRMGTKLGVWDPLVCAIRSAPALGDLMASRHETRGVLQALYQRTGDVALARRAGLRTRATAPPIEILSPREYEVLGLIARGFKNRDIARALFIAESTTKVHVRNILEKLGVRTRAEAAARLQMLAGDF